jgi:hypothetical protein
LLHKLVPAADPIVLLTRSRQRGPAGAPPKCGPQTP